MAASHRTTYPVKLTDALVVAKVIWWECPSFARPMICLICVDLDGALPVVFSPSACKSSSKSNLGKWFRPHLHLTVHEDTDITHQRAYRSIHMQTAHAKLHCCGSRQTRTLSHYSAGCTDGRQHKTPHLLTPFCVSLTANDDHTGGMNILAVSVVCVGATCTHYAHSCTNLWWVC